MINFEAIDSFDNHIQKFWFHWTVNILFKTVIPICIVIFWEKDFRTFILKTTQKIHPDVSILPATAAGISILTANIEEMEQAANQLPNTVH